MPMQWMVQDTLHVPGMEDDNAIKLIRALESLGQPYIAVGIIPFSHEITGLEAADPSAPTMFWGSVQMAATVAQRSDFRPGVSYQREWFDPRNWVGKRPDLLNENLRTITADQLRQEWVTEPTFCKSVEDKAYTGNVLEPVKEDHDLWLIEASNLDAGSELVLAPVQRLVAEYRFFVVKGRVVTGSYYRKEGIRRCRVPVEPETWAAAERMAQDWMPNDTIVMDIGLTDQGEYKVIEWNCAHSSGFYNCDLKQLVLALEEAHTCIAK